MNRGRRVKANALSGSRRDAARQRNGPNGPPQSNKPRSQILGRKMNRTYQGRPTRGEWGWDSCGRGQSKPTSDGPVCQPEAWRAWHRGLRLEPGPVRRRPRVEAQLDAYKSSRGLWDKQLKRIKLMPPALAAMHIPYARIASDAEPDLTLARLRRCGRCSKKWRAAVARYRQAEEVNQLGAVEHVQSLTRQQ